MSWIDVGNGKVKCDRTSRVVPSSLLRPDSTAFVMSFTDEEWQKLERLAEKRSTSKKTYTPEQCLRGFIEHLHLGEPRRHG